jgi:hypothetical protein
MREQKPKNPNKKTKTASPKKKKKGKNNTFSELISSESSSVMESHLSIILFLGRSRQAIVPQLLRKRKGKTKETTTTTTTTKKTKPAALDQNTKFLHHKTPIFCHRL